MLRLPHEVKELFIEWLEHHYPDRKERVLARIRECVNGTPEREGPHGDRLYNPAFGTRMRGQGTYAAMLRQRYDLATRRLGLQRTPYPFDTSRFRPPAAPASARGRAPRQLPLFR